MLFCLLDCTLIIVIEITEPVLILVKFMFTVTQTVQGSLAFIHMP